MTWVERIFDLELKWYNEDPDKIHEELKQFGPEIIEAPRKMIFWSSMINNNHLANLATIEFSDLTQIHYIRLLKACPCQRSFSADQANR